MLKNPDPAAQRPPENTFDPYQNSRDRAPGQPAPVILPEEPLDEEEEPTIELTDLLPGEGAGMRSGGLTGSNRDDR